jgi:hypothetical protein
MERTAQKKASSIKTLLDSVSKINGKHHTHMICFFLSQNLSLKDSRRIEQKSIKSYEFLRFLFLMVPISSFFKCAIGVAACLPKVDAEKREERNESKSVKTVRIILRGLSSLWCILMCTTEVKKNIPTSLSTSKKSPTTFHSSIHLLSLAFLSVGQGCSSRKQSSLRKRSI